MSRLFITLFVLSVVSFLHAQDGPMVKVSGKVLSAKDSTAVTTSILYEKLPYYDDMGLATANSNGEYSFMVVKDVNYNISIKKDPFVDFSQEIKVSEENGVVNFYLDVDKEMELIRLDNVIFTRGSDELQASSYAELNDLTDRMKNNHEMVIQLEGHTDFAGNPTANLALSEARVESVKSYLVKNGINKNRILTKAFGGTQPLYQERTPEAMAKNRRVEVRIIKK